MVGNLSTREEFFVTMRESGALQRLVALLDSGPTSRITEIAAKTLANLAVAESNRKGIRLAGGLPPLLRLLLERPTEQVRTQPCSIGKGRVRQGPTVGILLCSRVQPGCCAARDVHA